MTSGCKPLGTKPRCCSGPSPTARSRSWRPARRRTRLDSVLHGAPEQVEKPPTARSGISALVEGHRWGIEDSFETTKNELGLDHNETRSWHGWHRHVSLVMLAFAIMAIIRSRANTPPKKTRSRPRPKHPS